MRKRGEYQIQKNFKDHMIQLPFMFNLFKKKTRYEI